MRRGKGARQHGDSLGSETARLRVFEELLFFASHPASYLFSFYPKQLKCFGRQGERDVGEGAGLEGDSGARLPLFCRSSHINLLWELREVA